MRSLTLLLAAFLIVSSAIAQSASPERLMLRPLEALSEPLSLDNSDPADGEPLAIRIAELFRLQASLLEARNGGDEEEADRTLDEALQLMGPLLETPGATEDPAFAAIYRSLVSEYERAYGASDTLTTVFGEIFGVRAGLFAALNALEDPLLEDLDRSSGPALATTVPLPINDLVQRSIDYLLDRPERHIANWVSRSYTYMPMVEQIFAEEGVPDELKYLAMIESGLNPRARSWARAAGMWQFIAATGRYYDLQVDSWVDERMDPERATRAAARHLKDLYERHGDWHVALAGYNCSPRCIRRAKDAARARGVSDPDYWDMYPYLPRETRGYVPMFVAASILASNPQEYGLGDVTAGPTYAYEVVPVRGMLSMADVADMIGSDEATLKALNPALRRWTLPPSHDPYPLRLPIGTAEVFMAEYAKLPDSKKRPAGEHVVRSGDTLSEIASEFGVSVRELKSKNGLRNDRIRVGQRLVVPMGRYVSPVSHEDEVLTKAASVRYPGYMPKPLALQVTPPKPEPQIPVVTARAESQPTVEEAKSETPPASTRTTYSVRRGDTLSEIAESHGVQIRNLRAWNQLSSSRISVGQRLVIYTDGRRAPDPQEPVTYRVRSGDTLSEIAATYRVSTRDLRAWNNLSGSRIRAGQRLKIFPPAASQNAQTSYRVQRGDTLIEIAQRFSVSVSDLRTWNGISGSRIDIGQELKLTR